MYCWWSSRTDTRPLAGGGEGAGLRQGTHNLLLRMLADLLRMLAELLRMLAELLRMLADANFANVGLQMCDEKIWYQLPIAE